LARVSSRLLAGRGLRPRVVAFGSQALRRVVDIGPFSPPISTTRRPRHQQAADEGRRQTTITPPAVAGNPGRQPGTPAAAGTRGRPYLRRVARGAQVGLVTGAPGCV